MALLLADSALAALIGTRLYAGILPQSALMPAVVYALVSGVPQVAHDGPDGLERSRIQVDAWDDDYPGSVAVANAVKAVVNGVRTSKGGTNFDSFQVVGAFDLYEPETARFRRLIDVLVWWR